MSHPFTRLPRLWLDFSTQASRATKRYRYFNPGLCVILLCAAIVGVLGITLHPRLLLLWPAMAVLLIAGTIWPWLNILLVRGQLRFAKDRIHEREEVQSSLSLRFRLPWPAWGLVLKLDAANHRVLDTAKANPGPRRSRRSHLPNSAMLRSWSGADWATEGAIRILPNGFRDGTA